MADSREPSIKLFGKTIPMQPIRESPPISGGSSEEKDHKEESTPENMDQHHESPDSEEKSDPATSTASETDQPSAYQEDTTRNDSIPKQQSNETSNSQEKAPKKPNKILSCPRCKSPDTKFCYYNNYNTSQPRYFCKNCQRYWTAGGIMRNVPVGAGRRKNKNSISHYRHITMLDDTLQAVRSHAMEAIHHPNGIIFSFCSDIPPHESMTSILNSAEKTMKNCTQKSRYHQIEEKLVPLSCRAENGYKHSSGLSVMTSNYKQEVVAKTNLQGVPAPIPCFDGTPWPNQWSVATPFCTSSFAIPIYHDTAYWSCAVTGSRSIPWLSPLASSHDSGFTGSGPNSPSLGKHLSDGNVLKGSNVEKEDDLKKIKQERCIWVPKTSRTDDPDEAAKSSMGAMKLQS